MSDGFSASDWAVVVFVFALTTWIGHRMSGKPATLREFFLGGKRLPWYAVAGSIVATEISAVTLISLPAVVFKDGGNLSYLQLGIFGSFLARWLVALFVVPAYYEKEIYSPYDYMGARLGEGVRRTTTVLFSVGGVLGQAARVYLTAVVLEVILHEELARWGQVLGVSSIVLAISAIGTVSVLWTWMGGIATVIWTDVVLFALFLAAIAIALSTALAHVDGGVTATWEYAQAAGKLQFLNFSTRLSEDYTLWAALIAQGLGGLGTYGTDQLMAQRIFCCKNKREAQKAILASYGAMLVTLLDPQLIPLQVPIPISWPDAEPHPNQTPRRKFCESIPPSNRQPDIVLIRTHCPPYKHSCLARLHSQRSGSAEFSGASLRRMRGGEGNCRLLR
jgi:Na+/proline symporter